MTRVTRCDWSTGKRTTCPPFRSNPWISPRESWRNAETCPAIDCIAASWRELARCGESGFTSSPGKHQHQEEGAQPEKNYKTKDAGCGQVRHCPNSVDGQKEQRVSPNAHGEERSKWLARTSRDTDGIKSCSSVSKGVGDESGNVNDKK